MRGRPRGGKTIGSDTAHPTLSFEQLMAVADPVGRGAWEAHAPTLGLGGIKLAPVYLPEQYSQGKCTCTVVLKTSSIYRRYSAIDISVISAKVGMVHHFHTHLHHKTALVPLPFRNPGSSPAQV